MVFKIYPHKIYNNLIKKNHYQLIKIIYNKTSH